jgi:transcription elongation factor GreA
VSDTVWLSQAAYDRLKAELQELKQSGRARASAAIEAARAHGDLRENAEYEAAKEDQGKMESRIRQLEDILAHAHVGEPPSGETVQAGMVVTTADEHGDESTFLLGSREDRPEGLAVVSAQSPLGKALVGARVGDTVRYEAPAGAFTVTVLGAEPLAT